MQYEYHYSTGDISRTIICAYLGTHVRVLSISRVLMPSVKTGIEGDNEPPSCHMVMVVVMVMLILYTLTFSGCAREDSKRDSDGP